MVNTRQDAALIRLAKGFDKLLASPDFQEGLHLDITREPGPVHRLVSLVARSKLTRRVQVPGIGTLKDAVMAALNGKDGASLAARILDMDRVEVEAWLTGLGTANAVGIPPRKDKRIKDQAKKMHEVFSFFSNACNGDVTIYKDRLLKVDRGEPLHDGLVPPGYDATNVLFTRAHKTRQVLLVELGSYTLAPFDARAFTFIYRTGILATYLDDTFGDHGDFSVERVFGIAISRFATEHMQGRVLDVHGDRLDLARNPGLVEKIILAFCSGEREGDGPIGHCQDIPACNGTTGYLDGKPCPFQDGCHHHGNVAGGSVGARDTFPVSSFPVVKRVLATIRFKGAASRDALLPLVDLPGSMIDDALDTATCLGLVEASNVYRLSSTGTSFVDAPVAGQATILAKALLSKEFVKDLLFKIRTSDGSTLDVKELDNTFYMLMPGWPENEQKKALQSFIDLCVSANLLNTIKQRDTHKVEITATGAALLEGKNQNHGEDGEPPSESETIPVAGKCKGCGKPVGKGFVSCGYCGKSTSERCNGCGKELDPAYALCPWCGVTIETSN